ncbi:hypothetical protein [Knoellia aerolata]|uniref:hypothetical protein n=1 Tax=Knoellia aerolata TaxID=442954 RepID=UPI001B80670B|nr:hypothetical protein [Knoellia aerolata]
MTTTALGLALTWRRPVLLVEADPTGGSALLAGYFRGQTSPAQSLIDLAFAHRAGGLAEAIPWVAMQVPDTNVTMIAGTTAHGQARSLESLWEPLAATLKSLDAMGQDVIVDAGRLGLVGAPEPLMYAADLCLLVTRTDLVALAGARSWAQSVREGFEQQGGSSAVALLTVGAGRPYQAKEVSKVLELPVLASLAWDTDSATVFSHGGTAPRGFDRSPLSRSLRSTQDGVLSQISRTTKQLSSTTEASPALGEVRAGWKRRAGRTA